MAPECMRTEHGSQPPLDGSVRVSSVAAGTGLLLVVLSLSVAGCDVFGFDHSTGVAKALVYRADGKPDNAATTAAINARFPSGSKFTDLQTFVKALGGRCVHTRQQERKSCSIPVRGAFCVVHEIFFAVTTLPDDTIQQIEASGGMEAC